MDQYVERVVDLTDPDANQIYNLSLDEARNLLLDQSCEAVREIQGSFALLARSGKTVKMARSPRPAHALFSRQAAGRPRPDRRRTASTRSSTGSSPKDWTGSFIPATRAWFRRTTWSSCSSSAAPIPIPSTPASSRPPIATLPADLDVIGRTYISALAEEISQWLQTHSRRRTHRRLFLRRHR